MIIDNRVPVKNKTQPTDPPQVHFPSTSENKALNVDSPKNDVQGPTLQFFVPSSALMALGWATAKDMIIQNAIAVLTE